MSYVYFILDEKSNALKIGKANDIEIRRSELQTGNPNRLQILHSIECKSEKHSKDLEREYHNHFKHLHLIGEWFEFDEMQFVNFFNTKFKINSKEEPVKKTITTLFGEEEIDVSIIKPDCHFYPHLKAQVLDNYDKISSMTIPFRTMEWPTYGESKLLPYSNIKNRVFISTKKHNENLDYNRFLKEKQKQNELTNLENILYD